MKARTYNIFNRYAKRVNKPIASILLTFSLVASPFMAFADNKQEKISKKISQQTTYWKYKDTTIIVKAEPCEEKGICLTVIDFDPQNKDVKKLYKTLSENIKIDNWGERHPDNKEQDVLRLCEMTFKEKLTHKINGNWNGSRGNAEFTLKPKKDGSIKMTGTWWLMGFVPFWKNFPMTEIDTPPVSCLETRIKNKTASNN